MSKGPISPPKLKIAKIKMKHPINILDLNNLLSKNFSPSASAPQLIESGKTTLSSQFVQLPDTSINFHRPSTSRSAELTKTLEIPPNSPIESGFVQIMSIKYIKQVLILRIKFHPDLSTLSIFLHFRFQRFLFPPSSP